MDNEANQERLNSLEETTRLKTQQLELKLEEKEVVLDQIVGELGVIERNLGLQKEVVNR